MSGETTVVDTGVSDAELFEGATADVAETPEVTTEAPAVPDKPAEQPRDEQGKYATTEAPKVETPADKTPLDDDNGGQVPSWRVREINEEKRLLAEKFAAGETEREQLRQRIAAFERQQKPAEQPKEAKPDPLLDPEGYEKYLEKRFESRLLDNHRETSLRTAHRSYKDEFTQAYSAAQQEMAKGNVALAARMQQSSDPGETLIEWHREQKTMREVGNDPGAWLEKKLEERLKDPAFLAKAVEAARGVASAPTNGNARPAVNLPPSLSSLTRADNSQASADDSDTSDEALFKHAIR